MVSGPIVIIEDDNDDKLIFEEVLKELNIPNKIVWFENSKDAFTFLKNSTEQPFVIVSDINLPGQSGVEFKRQIDNDESLKKKSIPFIFFSTSADKSTIDNAFNNLTIQGFFQKADSYREIKNIIRAILDYWKYSKHPNTYPANN